MACPASRTCAPRVDRRLAESGQGQGRSFAARIRGPLTNHTNQKKEMNKQTKQTKENKNKKERKKEYKLSQIYKYWRNIK